MCLRDTYTDFNFKDINKRRDTSTGHGARKHNVNVRPLGLGHQSPKSAFDQVAGIQKQFLAIRDGSSAGGDFPIQSSVISTHE